jgi:outer membrane protein insertion porin family
MKLIDFRAGVPLAVIAIFLCSASIAAAQTPPSETLQTSQTPSAREPGAILSLRVQGAERLEEQTVLSYTKLRIGQTYSRELLDQALRELYETELFADVTIRDDKGELVIRVRENPVINRIVLEGNKRLKEDKIRPEIKLAARQIFTRSKARADVARIIELYRRQGRFAASVEPKLVQLDQNRVDIVFEISESPKSKVRQINIIGNDKFGDSRLRGEMVTKQSRWFRLFSSGTTYDPDRLAYDQQKLRQFYLTNGYADFRVISAVAELTPDKQDFIITYVVEEGDRYKFSDVKVESDIRDLSGEGLTKLLTMKKGDWYNAKQVEDTVDQLNETAGLFGYAFADVQPDFQRDKSSLTMGINFKIGNAPRVYVERVEINGNVITVDKVIRREFRLAEGDAFNSFLIKRSRDRILSLGFFQDNFEIEQKPGPAPDRIVLEANVQEKSTGELSLSAGYSSLESFIVSAGVTQRNFRGKGQELRLSGSISGAAKSVELGFTEPYLFDKNIALGGDIFRRDYDSSGSLSTTTATTYDQVTTGLQLRLGIPVTEYISAALRYGLSYDQVTLNETLFFSNGACDPGLAGLYLCDAVGNRLTSSIGYSLIFDNRNNRIRPSRGWNASLSQDFAGLGGDVRYVRTRADVSKYFNLGSGFVVTAHAEGGYIWGFGDGVTLTNRFFLGEPQIRGFDVRGIGPRIIRTPYDLTTVPATPVTTPSLQVNDALGGKAYYLGRLEMEIPLGSGAREMGLRPSIYLDAGAVFGAARPNLIDGCEQANNANPPVACVGPAPRQYTNGAGQMLYLTTLGAVTTTDTGIPYMFAPGVYSDAFYGDTPRPRISIGFGINWNSPMGPFRIDIAKAIVKAPGDDTKLITFNIGTQF